MTSGRLMLLEGLLGDAFAYFCQATPTVVSVKPSEEDTGTRASYEMPFSWPNRMVSTPEEVGPVVSEQLTAGPVLLVPPWTRRQDRGHPLSRDEHEIAILNCAQGRPDSMLAVLTPASMWISRSSGPVREELAKRWKPALVLYMTDAVPGVHRSFLLAAVFLHPREAQDSLLRIFRVPAGEDDQAITEDFRRVLRQGGGRGKFGYVLRDMPPPGDTLAYERHDPALAARRAELAVMGSTTTIGELFEVAPAGIAMDERKRLHATPAQGGTTRVITGRDLQRDGVIAAPDEAVTRWALVPEDRQLKAGDILLQRMFVPSDRFGLRAVEVGEADLPAVANDMVITLRARRPLSAPERILILGFLRSPLARQLAAVAAGTQPHLSREALLDVHLPQPDEALSTALEDLAHAATRFADWHAEAQTLLDSVFADDSAAGTRARIVGAGRKIRTRSEAAALLDDAGYTFRTAYPYPVAYRWREVEAAVSARSYKAAYEAILAAAEVLLCYAANAGLAIARESGIELGAMKTIRDRLKPGAHGLGFGDWVAVLREIEEGKATRRAAGDSPIADIRSFLTDSDAGPALKRLSDRRNDESHLRHAELMDLPVAVDAALADLSALYQAADFLSDLPLIQVTDFQWDSFRKRATMSYRELIGDHPVVPTRTITYDQPDVEKGSTYILDGQRRLWLLRPFLAGRICPRCRNWSTFHIDGRADGKVSYKSLEHGHPLEDATLDDALAYVSLLLHCSAQEADRTVIARRITEEDAVRAMLERGTQPLDPFPGTQKPWRCRCVTCGEESSPCYNNVVNKGTGVCNRTCRSKKIAAKLTRDAAAAVATMIRNGWEPIEDYPGAGKPWPCRRFECGAIKRKRLSHVQAGAVGCTNCAGRNVDDESAREVMLAAGLEPLVDYPGGLRPWLSRCITCSHIGSPCYSKVKMRGHQCYSCRSGAISKALRLTDGEATASMLDSRLEPLEPYPGGVEIPWRSRCMVCDTILAPGPALHNIRSGQGGCPTCAERGINPAKPGYLYLVEHDEHAALKWGIANIEQRIAQHVSQGWHLVARWDFELTRDAWEIERQVKSWVRGRGFPPALYAGQMKYRGHTETVLAKDVSLTEIRAYIACLAERAPTAPTAD